MEKEIGLLLREQRRKDYEETEKEINLYRSGSAPPTVEGSLSAVGGLPFREFVRNKTGNAISSEEELRSDPAYLAYYLSNVNLNPRLPLPILSKEDRRSAQIFQGGSSTMGGSGDRRKMNRNDSSGSGGGGGGLALFTMPPGFNSKKQESESSSEKVKVVVEWGGDDLIGLPGLGLGSKQKSLAEVFQDDLGRVTPAPKHPSRPVSCNTQISEAELVHLHRDLGMNMQSSSTVQHVGPPVSYSRAPALGTSFSATPTPRGRVEDTEKENISSKYIRGESVDLVSAFSGINLSKNGTNNEENHLPSHTEPNVHDLFKGKKSESGQFHMLSNSPLQVDMHKTGLGPNTPHLRGTSTYTLSSGGGLLSPHQHPDGANSSFPNYGFSGSYLNSPVMSAGHIGNYNLPPLFENAAAASMSVPGMDPRMFSGSQNLRRIGTHMTGNNDVRAPFVDPMYIQFLRALNDPSVNRNYMGNSSYMDLLQKAYAASLLQSGGFNHHGYNGNHPAFAVPLANPVTPNSVVGPGSPIRHGELSTRYQVRNVAGAMLGPWQLGPGYNVVDGFAPSLLEQFKANKTRCFQLSEIAGHVVEFSGDQYGSRFIQQKLETATTEEKNMVFEEIIPHAITLMADVFGNYVVQKFFECGMPSQRRELAERIFGHVLTLSLQMYGCRVIQKAIEVVDLDVKVKIVQELDGHIMRCVRDQNGNHVVQKCIECVPEEHIQFIVSALCDQVVTLSTHPYGCRAIQRVLEQCMDPQTQRKVMEQILGSISLLAQDRYGNYVVQHVLEHGQPNERSFIIQELAGKIVQMSQQKFASNVVEKCLAFGDPTERQLLVNEMLGSTDENEPLQAMIKDQFGNYVVQKVLETCSNEQRELILSRIKVHLELLKKYTYGKHIVARVEKLVDAGEKRIAALSPNLGLEP